MKFFLVECDFSSAPAIMEITADQFDDYVRQHADTPVAAERTIHLSRMTNGQYFLARDGSKRLLHQLTVDDAADRLYQELCKQTDATNISIGHDQNHTIYVYEHVRKLSKLVPKNYLGFPVLRKYVGKLRPAV